jgi:hypothetical protein
VNREYRGIQIGRGDAPRKIEAARIEVPHEHLVHVWGQQGGHGFFMRRIADREFGNHAGKGDTLGPEFLPDGFDTLPVQRLDLPAAVIQGSPNDIKVVVGGKVRRVHAGPCGHHHPDGRQLPLDHQVGGKGGAEHQALNGVRVRGTGHRVQALDDGSEQIVGIGGDFGCVDGSCVAHQNDIGMRSTSIESYKHPVSLRSHCG